MNVDSILDERAKSYGRFYDLAEVARRLRTTILKEIWERQKKLEPDQEEALTMICSKLARIINGDTNHIDSWKDIAGYCQLVVDRLEGKVR